MKLLALVTLTDTYNLLVIMIYEFTPHLCKHIIPRIKLFYVNKS